MTSRLASTAVSAGLMLLAGIAIAFALAGGCGKDPDGPKTNGKGGSAKNKPKPLLKDWPRPAFALVISGEQEGYLEPCGCTAENQFGGLAHRADLFRRLREERKWDVAGLDLGGLIARKRAQDQIKLEAILNGLKILGYRAVGLGTVELQMYARGSDSLLTLPGINDSAEDVQLPFVDANVDIKFETSRFGPRRSHRFSIGGNTIGVTAIVGDGTRRDVGRSKRLTLSDAREQLRKVLPELKARKPDYLVLLAYAPREETEKLVKDFPEFDVAVVTGGWEKSWKVGRTLFVNVGTKGRNVGVIGFYPDAKDKPLRFELVELDAVRFKNDPRMRDLMVEYQKALLDRMGPVFADARFGPHPSGKSFVGVASCRECHKKSYAKWITTKHAHAYKSLIEGRKDVKDWVPRQHDPECLACHTTGWEPQKVMRYASGFLIRELAESRNRPELFARLQGQQCENCHGPGSRHVALERKWRDAPKSVDEEALRQSRLAMQLRKEQVEKQDFCRRCHDLDNSPKFEFAKYWRDVEHKGKD